MLVDVSGDVPIKRKLSSIPKRYLPEGEEKSEKQALQDAKHLTCVTVFTTLGDHIIAGTNRGWLNIIETETCSVVHSHHLCQGVIVLLRLTQSGRDLVCNSSDRVVRTISIPDLSRESGKLENMTLEVEHKFQDVVNKLSWNHVAFSSTGEYVCASTYMNHDIYVWERGHGSIVKIMENSEELGVVEVIIMISLYFRLLILSSGIPIGLLLRLVVWIVGAYTFGPSSHRNDGQLSLPTLLRLKRTLNILKRRMNLIFILLKRSTSGNWISRTKTLMF